MSNVAMSLHPVDWHFVITQKYTRTIDVYTFPVGKPGKLFPSSFLNAHRLKNSYFVAVTVFDLSFDLNSPYKKI